MKIGNAMADKHEQQGNQYPEFCLPHSGFFTLKRFEAFQNIVKGHLVTPGPLHASLH